MALASIPSVLPPVRGPGFVPAPVPAAVLGPQAAFARIVESAVSAGTPLPATGLQNALARPDAVSLLDQSYFRDLVSGFRTVAGPLGALERTPAFTASLGVEGLLGRTGVPEALRGLGDREALTLYSAALGLFETLQALGADEGADEPGIGSLLDITV